MNKKLSSHPLVWGTLLLTLTGLISRTIGFFYRIYLSRCFGEEGMGIYQLLGPVLSLSFALTASGYQTAISKVIAEKTAGDKKASPAPFWAGFFISIPLSCLCAVLVCQAADFIALRFLQEPRTADMLRILSFSIPMSAVHACVNGYFYGRKKALVPALSQLTEQFTRVGCVWLLCAGCLAKGEQPDIRFAAVGLTIGELASVFLSAGAIFQVYKKEGIPKAPSRKMHFKSLPFSAILSMALPLTANRITLNFLQSIEAVSIPASLRLYGYDSTTALSVYGVLTGMALPFIFFPNALTSSVSILLLPVVSENHAAGNMDTVKAAVFKTLRYCGALGIFCLAAFVLFGNWMGSFLFHSPLAGYFITTLGFISPFLYLDTTLSAILQGLGLAGRLFLINVCCLLIRLLFVFYVVPHFGIAGYLWGLLASQLALGLLYLLCLYRFLRQKS